MPASWSCNTCVGVCFFSRTNVCETHPEHIAHVVRHYLPRLTFPPSSPHRDAPPNGPKRASCWSNGDWGDAGEDEEDDEEDEEDASPAAANAPPADAALERSEATRRKDTTLDLRAVDQGSSVLHSCTHPSHTLLRWNPSRSKTARCPALLGIPHVFLGCPQTPVPASPIRMYSRTEAAALNADVQSSPSSIQQHSTTCGL
mmetsp:Transcript_18626/g.43056  ORF Transcript_18626/g.43056 Transcript_18626/m.43056 type:complete len:201 (-) Transcript_18626:676-1278(-)